MSDARVSRDCCPPSAPRPNLLGQDELVAELAFSAIGAVGRNLGRFIVS
jgi:hypothetical protein